MNAKTAVRSNLLPSLLYFFYFAASGCITPFLNIFFQAKGISIAQISILGAMPMGLTLVAAPIWAGIADYFGLHRKILPLIIFLTMPFVALMGSANSFFFLLPAIISPLCHFRIILCFLIWAPIGIIMGMCACGDPSVGV
jgi:MFS family permease